MSEASEKGSPGEWTASEKPSGGRTSGLEVRSTVCGWRAEAGGAGPGLVGQGKPSQVQQVTFSGPRFPQIIWADFKSFRSSMSPNTKKHVHFDPIFRSKH